MSKCDFSEVAPEICMVGLGFELFGISLNFSW